MMNNAKKKMIAEELLEIIVASESNLRELDLLEYVAIEVLFERRF